jgi:predicted porin
VVTAFATYRNTDFFGLVDGLNFALQYQGKNGSPEGEGMTGVTNNGREALRQNGDGVGGSITYDIGEGFSGYCSHQFQTYRRTEPFELRYRRPC